MEKTIAIETSSYNQRRMGRPWIAKVDFTKSVKGEFIWGDWAGDHYNGGTGVLTISVNSGDIIATGQKDNRQPKNSAPDFFVVDISGNLEEIGDKGAAYKYYLEGKESGIDLDSLRAEKASLYNRIEEIDAILKEEK